MSTPTSHESRRTIAYERGSTPSLSDKWRNRIIMAGLNLALLMPTLVTTGCGEDPVADNPKPNPNEKPSEQYEYTRKVSSLTVEEGTFIKIDRTGNSNKVLVGNTVVFEFKGNLSIMFGGNIINGEFEITEPGDLCLCRGSDIVGEPCNIIVEKKGPEVSVLKDTVNVFGGVEAKIESNSLKVGEVDVAVWPEGCSVLCKIFDGSGKEIGSIESGKSVPLPENGIIELNVTNKEGGETTEKINLVSEVIYGLENYNPNLKVGQETNLLEGLSLADGTQLIGIDIQYGDKIDKVTSPWIYIRTQPGVVDIVYLIQTEFGGEGTVTKNNLEISPETYVPCPLHHKSSKDLFLDMGLDISKIEGDPYLDEYRLPETLKLLENNYENGTPSLYRDEYREAMNKFKLYLSGEKEGDHRTEMISILDQVSPYTTIQEVYSDNPYATYNTLAAIVEKDPNSKIIAIQSMAGDPYTNEAEFQKQKNEIEDMYIPNNKRLKIFQSGGNGSNINGTRYSIVCHKDTHFIVDNPHCKYENSSFSTPDNSLIAVFGSNYKGYLNYDEVKSNAGSCIPYGFPDGSVFLSNVIPHKYKDKVHTAHSSDNYSYKSSIANASSGAQFFLAGTLNPTANMDELWTSILETAKYDTINFNGNIYTIPSISLGGYINERLLPELPTSINLNSSDYIYLDKGKYLFNCVIFGIGVEFKIVGQDKWIECNGNEENWSQIQELDPNKIEMRINTKLLREKYGLKPGNSVDMRYGPVIKDNGKRWGLNLGKKTTITIEGDYLSEHIPNGNDRVLYVDKDGSLSYNADVPTFHDDINIPSIHIEGKNKISNDIDNSINQKISNEKSAIEMGDYAVNLLDVISSNSGGEQGNPRISYNFN